MAADFGLALNFSVNSRTFRCWARGTRAKASRKSEPMATVGVTALLRQSVEDLLFGPGVPGHEHGPALLAESGPRVRRLGKDDGDPRRLPGEFGLVRRHPAQVVPKLVADHRQGLLAAPTGTQQPLAPPVAQR